VARRHVSAIQWRPAVRGAQRTSADVRSFRAALTSRATACPTLSRTSCGIAACSAAWICRDLARFSVSRRNRRKPRLCVAARSSSLASKPDVSACGLLSTLRCITIAGWPACRSNPCAAERPVGGVSNLGPALRPYEMPPCLQSPSNSSFSQREINTTRMGTASSSFFKSSLFL
jgi:hypothetical protein